VAQAFCRERTEPDVPLGDCGNDPSYPVLHWTRGCMTYVFNRLMFERVPAGETFVRDVFERSFQHWADVECASRAAKRPFLVRQSRTTTATTRAEFLKGQSDNEAIVVLRTPSEWADLEGHVSTAIAVTSLWHVKKTGEILDVDMELNGGAGTFSDCEESDCFGEMIDLENTITHEAGHLLGLGHSAVASSTMAADAYASAETQKRSLEPDDEAGYCAVDLPEAPCVGARCVCPPAPIFPPPQARAQACSTSEAGSRAAQSGSFAALLLSVVGSSRIRRRQRHRQSATANR
jgi:hypothetical protein